jgi:[acyl-carrier-protein] S-malonyltransferase
VVILSVIKGVMLRTTVKSVRNYSTRNDLLAVCFPGQGFQKLGMLTQFYKSHPKIVQPILEELDESLKAKLSQALINESASILDSGTVNLTSNAQPLLLTAGYTIFRIFDSLNNIPYGYFLGHSLGEYTAWTAAGILPFSNAVQMVHQRGIAMENATDFYHKTHCQKTGMTSVFLPTADETSNRLAHSALSSVVKNNSDVDFGNINSRSHIVLSGVKQSISDVVAEANSRLGGKFRMRIRDLNVSGPFHSRIMAPGQAIMHDILVGSLGEDPQWNWPPEVPVISNITARPFQNLEEVKTSVVNTLTETVHWSDSVKFANQNGCNIIISLGPGRIGKHMTAELKQNSETIYVDTPDGLPLA